MALLVPGNGTQKPKDLPHISLTKKLTENHIMSLDVSAQASKNLQTLKPTSEHLLGKICPADEDNLPAAFMKREVGECGKCVGEWGKGMGRLTGETSSRVNLGSYSYTLGSTGSCT